LVGNYIRTEEYKKDMSEKLKGRKITWGNKISAGKKGIKLSEKTKKKMSESHKGISHPNMSRKGSKNPAWKGGRFRDPRGYISIYMPEHPYARRCYIFEHRLIMEKKLGRLLDPKNEVIHHLNGIKDDNRLENLCVMKRGEHTNQTEPYKKKIRELEEIIKRNAKYDTVREEFPEWKMVFSN